MAEDNQSPQAHKTKQLCTVAKLMFYFLVLVGINMMTVATPHGKPNQANFNKLQFGWRDPNVHGHP